jgi:uncharacterized protein YukE
MPGGDPAQLETLADQLEVLGIETGNLGADTTRAATSIPSDADWTGDAADSFSGFAENLGQGASAAEGPLQRMGAAVRQYASYLSTAQQQTQFALSTSLGMENTGTGMAGLDAQAAIDALQQAGTDAAAQVTSAAAELESLYRNGQVQTWIDKQTVLGEGYTLVPEDQPPKGDMPIWEPEPPKGDMPIWEPDPPQGDIPILEPEPGDFPGDIPISPGLLGPLINYEANTKDGKPEDEPEDEPTEGEPPQTGTPQGGIALPGTTGTGVGFGPDGQPVAEDGVDNYTRPPVNGDTNYQVFDPNDKGLTVTDIDKVSNGTLVEQKSATGDDPRMNIPAWVQKNVTEKLNSYYQARQYIPGYENAPFGIDFTQPGATSQFQQAVQQAASQWEAAHPGIPVTISWSNP